MLEILIKDSGLYVANTIQDEQGLCEIIDGPAIIQPLLKPVACKTFVVNASIFHKYLFIKEKFWSQLSFPSGGGRHLSCPSYIRCNTGFRNYRESDAFLLLIHFGPTDYEIGMISRTSRELKYYPVNAKYNNLPLQVAISHLHFILSHSCDSTSLFSRFGKKKNAGKFIINMRCYFTESVK